MSDIANENTTLPAEGKLLFSELPTEIIQQILLFLPPDAFLAVSHTSKPLRTITDTPILWRHFCTTHFKHWDPRHNLSRALVTPVDDIAWKQWYISRQKLDRQVDLLVDELVRDVRGRIERIETIVNIETDILTGNRNLWDVKDALLRHTQCPDDAPDVLARRFWAQATIQRLERARAVSLWAAIKDNEHALPLERALAAYDMFVDGLSDAECHDISPYLDSLATKFKRDNIQYDEWTTREKATALAHFLRAQGYRGTQDVFYHNLPNNFIVRCLRDPEHPALPIICVAVYCAVAQRLGINANPCGFPMHVYAVIASSNGQGLGGAPWPEENEPEQMHIDAFRPEVIVQPSHLHAQLNSFGASVTSAIAARLLGPASNVEIVIRTARNILQSHRMAQNRPVGVGQNTDTENWPDIDVSLYAALFVLTYLQEGETGTFHQQRRAMQQYLPVLCELFQNNSPWDVSLFEEYILPLLVGLPEYGQMVQILRVVRRADEMKKPVVRRVKTDEHGNVVDRTDGKVAYKIGQVFRHARFNYMGVIIGWDTRCDASEEWIRQMGIDTLEKKREQSFYHVLADDKSNRYVAQDNIVATDDEPTHALMKLAGRFFLRYDKVGRRFVSNMREEYPDD